MFPTSHLLAFALISFVLIIVPGPNVLFVISRSLMLGRVAGVGTGSWSARATRR
jgi:threonine/homoserine/homoserine lactone efflux protein